jgi:hypothetical protein
VSAAASATAYTYQPLPVLNLRLARPLVQTQWQGGFENDNSLKRSTTMINGLRIGLFGALVLSTAVHHSALAAPASFYVGTCKPGKSDFTTIQAAVNAVPPGSTIDVCPGSYPEQVTITQSLTLQGITSGNGAAAIIAAPASGTLTATLPLADNSTAQVLVSNPGGAVNLSGLVVDGTGLADASPISASIAYNSASGTIDHVSIKKIPPTNMHSAGVSIQDDSGVSPSVSVENSSIDTSDTDSNAPFGIMAGLFNTAAGQGTITLTASNNTITNSEIGIEIQAGVAATISGNLISGGSGDGIDVEGGNQTVKIASNTLNVGRGIQLSDSTASTMITGNTILGSYGIFLSGVTGATTLSGNRLIGPAINTALETDGIYFDCSAMPLTASGNSFTNFTVALASLVQDSAFAKAPGIYVNVPTIETLCN